MSYGFLGGRGGGGGGRKFATAILNRSKHNILSPSVLPDICNENLYLGVRLDIQKPTIIY